MLPTDILEFWFSDALQSPEQLGKRSPKWFVADRDFDNDIAAKFSELCHDALTGRLRTWEKVPRDRLALILLLDQFPRNIYRGRREAFGGDARALALAQAGIDRKQDEDLHPVEAAFFLMPLQHAEDRVVQQRSISEFARLVRRADAMWQPWLQSCHDFAVRHAEIVAKFGRFPHRNRVMGRKPTLRESVWLENGGDRFGQ